MRALISALVIPMVFVAITPESGFAQCTWIERSTTNPPPRGWGLLAFDSSREVVVLFGGDWFGPPLDETWEWDGATWTQIHVPGPGGRTRQAMAFDSARGVVVVHGGWSGGPGFKGDTWEYDGTAWTPRPETGPSARNAHAMAFDDHRHRCVLFGGSNGSTLAPAQTWEWDGTSWSVASTTGPSPRNYVSMAFDSARGVCVMYGGANYPGTDVYSDTWEWDGTQWSQVCNSCAPGPRWTHTMAYDSMRERVVLFDQNSVLWGWDGVSWEIIVNPPEGLGGTLAFDSSRGVLMAYDGGGQHTWEFPHGAPVFNSGPDSVEIVEGGVAQFHVELPGPEPTLYVWSRDGDVLVDDERITGAQTATLTVSPVARGDAGEYVLLVANACGETVSNPATLQVYCTADWNRDAVVNVPDIFGFLTCWFAGDVLCANFNGDCCINVGDIFDYLTAWFAGCP